MSIKLKTLKSLKKRIKTTASGKYLHFPSGTSHNNSKKNSKRKRRLHRPTLCSQPHRLQRLLPYM